MRFEKIRDVIVCHLDEERHFFVSPQDLGKIASLDFTKIRLHKRNEVSQVIYIDEDGKYRKLNRIIADCLDNTSLAVSPANDNPLDLRSENLLTEKLGYHNTDEYLEKKKQLAKSLSPLPLVKKQVTAVFKEKEKSTDPTPNSFVPRHGKLSINPVNDDISLELNDFKCVLTKDNPYQNAKTLTVLFTDQLGIDLS